MTFNLDEFLRLAREAGTDTETVEVKAAARGLPRTITETISAFANTSGGTIVCGLSEQDGFTPAESFDAKRISAALAQACADKMEPPVRAVIEIIPTQGALAVVARIPETEPRLKPCYVKARPVYDGAFCRTGDGDRKLTRYEIDRLLEERTQPRYDAAVVPEADMDELDAELTSRFLARERANSPRIFATLDDEAALLSLGVAARDAHGALRPTFAGLMALGLHPQRHFPRCNVTFAVFPGTTKQDLAASGARFFDARTIIGSIPVMIAETLASVRRNMRMESRIGTGRAEIPEYPEVAVREAVANSLMHRDYSPEGCASPVQVNLFPDRLEVLSPGGLYGAVTVDSLGTYGISASRNQTLSRILESSAFPEACAESGYVVENKGTGYAQIQAALAKSGMPAPEPEDSISAFALTLRKAAKPASRPRQAAHSASQSDILLDAFRQHGTITTAQAASILGVSHTTAYRAIRKLIEAGTVHTAPNSSGRTTRYVLMP